MGWQVGRQQAVSVHNAVFDPKQHPFPNMGDREAGYAVGALAVDGEDLVNALQIKFMRINADGTLDPSDSYTSPVIGNWTGKAPVVLGGTGAPVIGIHGRRGVVLDAVGL